MHRWSTELLGKEPWEGLGDEGEMKTVGETVKWMTSHEQLLLSQLSSSGSLFFRGQTHYLGPQQNVCQLDEDLEQLWDVERPCLFEEASRSGGGTNRRGCGYVSSFGAVSVLISNVGDGVDDAIGSGVRVRALHHLRMGSGNPRKRASESA